MRNRTARCRRWISAARTVTCSEGASLRDGRWWSGRPSALSPWCTAIIPGGCIQTAPSTIPTKTCTVLWYAATTRTIFISAIRYTARCRSNGHLPAALRGNGTPCSRAQRSAAGCVRSVSGRCKALVSPTVKTKNEKRPAALTEHRQSSRTLDFPALQIKPFPDVYSPGTARMPETAIRRFTSFRVQRRFPYGKGGVSPRSKASIAASARSCRSRAACFFGSDASAYSGAPMRSVKQGFLRHAQRPRADAGTASWAPPDSLHAPRWQTHPDGTPAGLHGTAPACPPGKNAQSAAADTRFHAALQRRHSVDIIRQRHASAEADEPACKWLLQVGRQTDKPQPVGKQRHLCHGAIQRMNMVHYADRTALHGVEIFPPSILAPSQRRSSSHRMGESSVVNSQNNSVRTVPP